MLRTVIGVWSGRFSSTDMPVKGSLFTFLDRLLSWDQKTWIKAKMVGGGWRTAGVCFQKEATGAQHDHCAAKRPKMSGLIMRQFYSGNISCLVSGFVVLELDSRCVYEKTIVSAVEPSHLGQPACWSQGWGRTSHPLQPQGASLHGWRWWRAAGRGM